MTGIVKDLVTAAQYLESVSTMLALLAKIFFAGNAISLRQFWACEFVRAACAMSRP
jgi:hypothetical protein